jgi:hypothetical protein
MSRTDRPHGSKLDIDTDQGPMRVYHPKELSSEEALRVLQASIPTALAAIETAKADQATKLKELHKQNLERQRAKIEESLAALKE